MAKHIIPTEMNLTFLASQFQQPIADLVACLVARPYTKPDRVGSNYDEGGYSASAILLIVAMVESMIQHDRYFFGKSRPIAKSSKKASEYVRTILRYRRHAHVKELFELRNAIAHNHVWEVEYRYLSNGGRRHSNSNLVPDLPRLSRLTGNKIPRTPIKRFNLLPTRIDRTDLLKALATCVHLLEFLACKGNNPINLARRTIVLPGHRPPFSGLAQVVQDALLNG